MLVHSPRDTFKGAFAVQRPEQSKGKHGPTNRTVTMLSTSIIQSSFGPSVFAQVADEANLPQRFVIEWKEDGNWVSSETGSFRNKRKKVLPKLRHLQMV